MPHIFGTLYSKQYIQLVSQSVTGFERPVNPQGHLRTLRLHPKQRHISKLIPKPFHESIHKTNPDTNILKKNIYTYIKPIFKELVPSNSTQGWDRLVSSTILFTDTRLKYILQCKKGTDRNKKTKTFSIFMIVNSISSAAWQRTLHTAHQLSAPS